MQLGLYEKKKRFSFRSLLCNEQLVKIIFKLSDNLSLGKTFSQILHYLCYIYKLYILMKVLDLATFSDQLSYQS